ncbi:hypothetical protein H8S90_13755 [Olivibacter sp. SDN3]|uniref:hypothetical protein n=1 Tax=Olivibacter sp. SDN3 TaxID=2764720 RepID=UPI0016518486|nr:hypothetical protein [Olivibacter sp. SDN3]QNL47884.1 hypothetical protein H8S90_13755 [Olivibacter sp. SDN3]
MQVKFSYMYRDGANYKNHGEVIMYNPENLSVIDATHIIHANLIDEMYFYAYELGVPDLHFSHWNNQYDHSWHEFVSLEETQESATTKQSLSEFLNCLKKQL